MNPALPLHNMFNINLLLLNHNYPIAYIFWAIMTFLVGSSIGSFLNVCIWRIPLGESVVFVQSHCPKCNHKIKWYENIPLLSYSLLLRGKCSGCKQSISPRYFLIELATGIFFLVSYLCLGIQGGMFYEMFPIGAIIMLSVAGGYIDIHHRIIPNKLTYSAIIFGIGFYLLLYFLKVINLAFLAYIFGSIIAVFIIFSLFAIIGEWIFKQDALGWGDVKFLIAIAALSGIANTFFVMLIGSISGIIYGIIRSIIKKQPLKNSTIAFGPFLGGAAIIMTFLTTYNINFITKIIGKL